MNEDDKKVAEYLATGGKITKCPPGPSEGVVYRRGTFARRRGEEKPAQPAAAAQAPESRPDAPPSE